MDLSDWQKLEIQNLSSADAKSFAEKLREQIKFHNRLYYQEDNPQITDQEYDFLLRLLESLEQAFPELALAESPTKKVGASASARFAKLAHIKPMLSLNNCFDEEEFTDFIEKAQRFLNISYFPELACELKIDGLSINLRYENGKLVSAATRGDGFIGEDVTANVLTIASLPSKIIHTDLLEVRGEIYIDKRDFIQLNHEQELSGKNKFASARNLAAGSLRQIDSKITEARPLKYFMYGVGHSGQKIAQYQTELLVKLKQFGFSVPEYVATAKNYDEAFAFYSHIMNIRADLPFEIDGIVYKINNLLLQDRLGYVERAPRFAIAYKFPAEQVSTILRSITTQVGRTGVITPVAELEPVAVSGAIIKRATLHNFQEIKRKDIRMGDKILLERAGDVIPKITAVDFTYRQNKPEFAIYPIPTSCPSCGSALSYDEGDMLLRCENKHSCPAQTYEKICHFVSRGALNIEGFAANQIDFLLENQIISNVTDIFTISEENYHELSKMHGWGGKSVQNLKSSIAKAKTVALSNFIYALGIRHIGAAHAKDLAIEFGNVDDFILALLDLRDGAQETAERINNLQGVGNKILDSLREFASYQDNIEMLRSLKNILDIQPVARRKEGLLLAGNIIVFTGTMQAMSRDEAKAVAESLGAKVANSISKNTTFLVSAESSGSKLKKALELGVKVIGESEWLELIGRPNEQNISAS